MNLIVQKRPAMEHRTSVSQLWTAARDDLSNRRASRASRKTLERELASYSTPAEQNELDAILDRTRNGGAEIVKYLKTGSAYYAPSSGAVQMAEAIAFDQKRILPCSVWLEGEYGMKGLYLGVPAKIGRKGIEKIFEVTLTADERAALAKSAEAVREPMGAIKF